MKKPSEKTAPGSELVSSGLEGSRAPQTSFRRRVGLSKFPGRFPGFGLSLDPQPSHSFVSEQWLASWPDRGPARRLQWRDRGRFARPFLFIPTFFRSGSPQELQEFSKNKLIL